MADNRFFCTVFETIITANNQYHISSNQLVCMVAWNGLGGDQRKGREFMAKQLRKLTNAMKRTLSKHELNADDFRLVTQDTKYFTVKHVTTGEQMTFAK